jgi:hypothetical protein
MRTAAMRRSARRARIMSIADGFCLLALMLASALVTVMIVGVIVAYQVGAL